MARNFSLSQKKAVAKGLLITKDGLLWFHKQAADPRVLVGRPDKARIRQAYNQVATGCPDVYCFAFGAAGEEGGAWLAASSARRWTCSRPLLRWWAQLSWQRQGRARCWDRRWTLKLPTASRPVSCHQRGSRQRRRRATCWRPWSASWWRQQPPQST